MGGCGEDVVGWWFAPDVCSGGGGEVEGVDVDGFGFEGHCGYGWEKEGEDEWGVFHELVTETLN